jgi:hypothetical protein
MSEEFSSKEGFSVVLVLANGVVGVDPTDIYELFFVEDIYSYCISGKMVFSDMFGILEYGPLTGNERLIISYGGVEAGSGFAPGPVTRRLTFDIIKISNITNISGSDPRSGNQIEIFFADTSFFFFTRRLYSKAWNGNKKIQTIVENIIDNMVKGPNLKYEDIIWDRKAESDTTIENFIMPYWSPMQTIQWLNKRAVTKRNYHAYLYYNSTYWTKDTGYNMFSGNWTTIDDLMATDDENHILKAPYVFFGSPYDSGDESDDGATYVSKILDWKLGGVDEQSKRPIKGGHFLSYKFDGKKLMDRTYKYTKENDTEDVDLDMIKNIQALGNKSLFTDISDSRSNIRRGLYKEYAESNNILYSEFIRIYTSQQHLSVIVRGYQGRFAGQMAEIRWPTSSSENTANKNLKGLWLTKSITHNFGTRTGYTQRIVLVKNAYHESDEESLITIPSANRHLKNISGSIIQR